MCIPILPLLPRNTRRVGTSIRPSLPTPKVPIYGWQLGSHHKILLVPQIQRAVSRVGLVSIVISLGHAESLVLSPRSCRSCTRPWDPIAVASLLPKHSTRVIICVIRNPVVVSSQPPARFIRTAATDAPVEARVGGTTVMNPEWTLWAEAVSISVSLRQLGRHDGRMTYYGSTQKRSRAVGRCGQSTRSICSLANWLLAAATAIYLIPRQLLRDGYLRMQRNQEKFQIWRVGPW
ncbi:hypothetical protein V8F33_010803 [Rhypophila sp. PSN 637]